MTKKCIFVVFAEKYVFAGLAENEFLEFGGKCVLTKKCVFAGLMRKCLSAVLAGKCVFAVLAGKVRFCGFGDMFLTKKYVLRV